MKAGQTQAAATEARAPQPEQKQLAAAPRGLPQLRMPGSARVGGFTTVPQPAAQPQQPAAAAASAAEDVRAPLVMPPQQAGAPLAASPGPSSQADVAEAVRAAREFRASGNAAGQPTVPRATTADADSDAASPPAFGAKPPAFGAKQRAGSPFQGPAAAPLPESDASPSDVETASPAPSPPPASPTKLVPPLPDSPAELESVPSRSEAEAAAAALAAALESDSDTEATATGANTAAGPAAAAAAAGPAVSTTAPSRLPDAPTAAQVPPTVGAPPAPVPAAMQLEAAEAADRPLYLPPDRPRPLAMPRSPHGGVIAPPSLDAHKSSLDDVRAFFQVRRLFPSEMKCDFLCQLHPSAARNHLASAGLQPADMQCQVHQPPRCQPSQGLAVLP